MTPERRLPSLPEKLFRALLRLLPRRFRGEYGRDMEQVFRDQLGRSTAIVPLLLRTSRDVLASAVAERRAVVRTVTAAPVAAGIAAE
ncbi:MAG: hypothetical protein M3273_07765, partial [Actinomycetota bacterium]|nr:hypothetical protein [Actinomycetota bacterium]